LDFFWQNGGEVITPDGRVSAFNTPEGVEALEYYVDLYRTLIPPGTAALPSEMIPSFPAGRIGMKIDSRYAVVEMEQYAPHLVDEIGIALPIGRQRRAGVVYTDYWTITTQAKHPDEAWKFLEFLMEPESLVAYNETMGFLPPRISMQDHPYVADDRTARIFMEALVEGHVRPYPVVVNGREFGEFLGEEIEMAVQGMKSPAEALADAEERVNDSLRRAWRSLERR
ncbi:MAG: extracellular solute-binding protein, partial [Firmicutes bacterium]|nr:extracellular solute-binding protein [Bacillota bacterium]